MCNTRSFATVKFISPSTFVKIALPVCSPSGPASLLRLLGTVDISSFCFEYSGFLIFTVSTPESKFRDSTVGNSFIWLLCKSFEEDHSSPASLRLTWPNIGSSLLQNCHLWGYAVQWIPLVREKRIIIGTRIFQRIILNFYRTKTKKNSDTLIKIQDLPPTLVLVIRQWLICTW